MVIGRDDPINTKQEAREVLGVEVNASESQIKTARKTKLRNPGNLTFSQINQAFDLLLRELNRNRAPLTICPHCDKEIATNLTRFNWCISCSERKVSNDAIKEIENILHKKNLWDEVQDSVNGSPWWKLLHDNGINFDDWKNFLTDNNSCYFTGEQIYVEEEYFDEANNLKKRRVKREVEIKDLDFVLRKIETRVLANKQKLKNLINLYQGSRGNIPPEVQTEIENLIQVVNQAKSFNRDSASLPEIENAIASLNIFAKATANSPKKRAWSLNNEAWTILAELQIRKNGEVDISQKIIEAIQEIERELKIKEKPLANVILGSNWKKRLHNAKNAKQINNIKEQLFDKIADYRINGNDNGGHENLQSKIRKAIQEIENELNREPKITWKSNSSFKENWRAYLEDSSNFSELKTRKEELLSHIRTAREQKKGGNNLTELRLRAIHLIKQELEENSISASELTNQNWENDINNALKEEEINFIKAQVLTDIKNKRATKREKNHLTELLIQAKQEVNWNDYEKLEALLKQIKVLRSSDAYQEKESEIQEVEKRLQELNPDKFQGTTENSLDQQLKDNGLNDSNMDNETKQALAEAKQDPTPEKVAKAEEKIAQNGATNYLNKLLTQTWKQLKKGNLTKKEKEEKINELLQFINKNNFTRAAYEKQNSEVNKLLAELRGQQSQDNTQNPSFWKKALVPLLIISLLGIIMITSVLIWRRKRLKRN